MRIFADGHLIQEYGSNILKLRYLIENHQLKAWQQMTDDQMLAVDQSLYTILPVEIIHLINQQVNHSSGYEYQNTEHLYYEDIRSTFNFSRIDSLVIEVYPKIIDQTRNGTIILKTLNTLVNDQLNHNHMFKY